MQNRREFIKSISLATYLSPFLWYSCKKVTSPSRPNIIVIITDDQGYGDFGVTGNPFIQTPNIDDLAKQSTQMTNYYVSPVCAPTRACLMTGRYNYRTRAIDTYIGRAMMEPEEVTLAEILKENGYATGIFGKWHLGDNYPMRPQDQGFEEVLVLRGGGIGQPSDPPGGEGKYTDPILFSNGKQIQKKGYCTDIYFDEGLTWMEGIHNTGKNFFLYLPTNAPHGPFNDVPEELYQHYASMDLSNRKFPQDKGNPLPEDQDPDNRARIYAMITNIDQNIGKLLKKLNDLKLAENTMVFFMVDNGPNGNRYVAGMRGKKSDVYEGGIHSPLFVLWPKMLPAGHKNDRVVAHIDVLPTILDACNITTPRGLKLDGRNFMAQLKNEKSTWEDRYIVIQSHRGNTPVRYHNFAIRNQKWKMLHASGFGKENFEGEPNFELYDMENDPLEQKEVSGENPGIVQKMKDAYDAWFDDVSHTRPNNYDPPRIYIGSEFENPVVLTRQDWRHIKGRPWAPDSNGFWLLHAATSGKYNILLNFRPTGTIGKVRLEMGKNACNALITENQTEHLFEGIEIEQGDLKLQATIAIPDNTMGPWQVTVTKI
jgi:arylsulfatase A-like enzyme